MKTKLEKFITKEEILSLLLEIFLYVGLLIVILSGVLFSVMASPIVMLAKIAVGLGVFMITITGTTLSRKIPENFFSIFRETKVNLFSYLSSLAVVQLFGLLVLQFNSDIMLSVLSVIFVSQALITPFSIVKNNGKRLLIYKKAVQQGAQ